MWSWTWTADCYHSRFTSVVTSCIRPLTRTNAQIPQNRKVDPDALEQPQTETIRLVMLNWPLCDRTHFTKLQRGTCQKCPWRMPNRRQSSFEYHKHVWSCQNIIRLTTGTHQRTQILSPSMKVSEPSESYSASFSLLLISHPWYHRFLHRYYSLPALFFHTVKSHYIQMKWYPDSCSVYLYYSVTVGKFWKSATSCCRKPPDVAIFKPVKLTRAHSVWLRTVSKFKSWK